MRTMEVFFDYACPYCLAGHELLKELLQKHSDIEIVWRPCEAHPRPEKYGLHSDLCIQGLLYVLEHGGDVWAYHDAMYNAAIKKRANIEDAEVVAGYAHDVVEQDKLVAAIRSGIYEESVIAANDYAYEQSGVWVVPAYRMGGKKLDSVEDVGVTKAQLDAFMGNGSF